jgi:hypothetical protein
VHHFNTASVFALKSCQVKRNCKTLSIKIRIISFHFRCLLQLQRNNFYGALKASDKFARPGKDAHCKGLFMCGGILGEKRWPSTHPWPNKADPCTDEDGYWAPEDISLVQGLWDLSMTVLHMYWHFILECHSPFLPSYIVQNREVTCDSKSDSE